MSSNYSTFAQNSRKVSTEYSFPNAYAQNSNHLSTDDHIAIAEALNDQCETDLDEESAALLRDGQPNKQDNSFSPLQICRRCFPRRLSRLGKFIVFIAVITLIIVFLMLIFG